MMRRAPFDLNPPSRQPRRLPAVRQVIAHGTLGLILGLAIAAQCADGATGVELPASVRPILQEYCWDCHADGANKGGVSFDQFKSAAALHEDHELWLRALKNVRAGLMPPPQKPQPSPGQKQQLDQWIRSAVFRLDPKNPDPGRVTVRRLNRIEYRNTIRDLLDVDFDTDKEFPPDDAGYGFDNIGDVLTLPPMLLEKYLAAAKTIVNRGVPAVARVPAERTEPGRNFRGAPSAAGQTNRNASAANAPNTVALSYYESASVTNAIRVEHAGRYQLLLDFTANERFVDNQFDLNKCRLVFSADGRELHRQDYGREGGKAFHFEFDQDWTSGQHELVFAVEPLTPDQKQVRSLTLRIDSLTLRGPLDEAHWVRPKNYERYFPGTTPNDFTARRQYTRDILNPFVRRAYRRPVDDATVDRLVAIAEATSGQPGKTFEAGVGQAMVAVLASPRFLFREETIETGDKAGDTGSRYPLVDEYALASRLSYFLWSSMPDDELLQLAERRQLRANLDREVQRLLAHKKSATLVRNFVGQWLQTRDIETVSIDARQVLFRESPIDPDQERRRARFRELRDKDESTLTPEEKQELATIRSTFFRRSGQPVRAELTGDVRRAMRQETEKTFDFILRENRSLLELLDSDYTFLNEKLARHYGLTNLNVTGDDLVRVTLPADSPRGGVITHGSVLAVTSNPTRTSPVKRGLFILDNLLGAPPPPPPANIPPLEDATKGIKDRKLTLRETLALHREQPLCSSCHNRMDPLGLALDNFNAMGMWRDRDLNQPIDATGTLISGERFSSVKELKRILVANHAREFYQTITEKLLTYALGRGLEFYDVATVDAIVDRLVRSNGRPADLLAGIIQSAPFQKTRTDLAEPGPRPDARSGDRAALTP